MIETAPAARYTMTFEEAILYCQFCNHSGYMDWRIPTEDEWRNVPGIWGWYIGWDLQWPARFIDQLPRIVVPVRDI